MSGVNLTADLGSNSQDEISVPPKAKGQKESVLLPSMNKQQTKADGIRLSHDQVRNNQFSYQTSQLTSYYLSLIALISLWKGL